MEVTKWLLSRGPVFWVCADLVFICRYCMIGNLYVVLLFHLGYVAQT